LELKEYVDNLRALVNVEDVKFLLKLSEASFSVCPKNSLKIRVSEYSSSFSTTSACGEG
jgi:hypothetical protein